MSRDTCQRCPETSQCALGGIRTPNLLIRRLGGLVSGRRNGTDSGSATVIRQFLRVPERRRVAVSVAAKVGRPRVIHFLVANGPCARTGRRPVLNSTGRRGMFIELFRRAYRGHTRDRGDSKGA